MLITAFDHHYPLFESVRSAFLFFFFNKIKRMQTVIILRYQDLWVPVELLVYSWIRVAPSGVLLETRELTFSGKIF